MKMEEGTLVPNLAFRDADGIERRLWDWRQKSHVALVAMPGASAAEIRAKQAESEAHRKTWLWLKVALVFTTSDVAPFGPGVHLVDRYGLFLNSFPLGSDVWERIERDYLYHEACNC